MGWLIVASFAAANGNGESVVVETEVAGRAIVSASEPNVATTAVAAATPTTEATTVPSTTTAQSTFAVVGNDEFGRARRQLAAATVVAQFVDFSDYDRDTYDGSGWPDADGDCQSDRHEILIEESLVEVTFDADGCRVETGLWLDPYDGTEYTSAEQVSIDHVIPLAAAHRAGAWQWDQPSRRAFAFDITFPATHAVVGSGVNQAKADRGPEDWRPPAEEVWCRYAVDWTAVKDRWSLAFTNAEVLALGEMLGTCEPVEQIAAIGGDGAIGATTPTAVDVTPTTSTTSTSTTSSSTTAPTTTLPPATAAPTSVVVVTQAPDLDCHPNYLPCIPNRPGDALNCGDIGRRVSVIGGDPYRLDLDNDGFGCDASG